MGEAVPTATVADRKADPFPWRHEELETAAGRRAHPRVRGRRCGLRSAACHASSPYSGSARSRSCRGAGSRVGDEQFPSGLTATPSGRLSLATGPGPPSPESPASPVEATVSSKGAARTVRRYRSARRLVAVEAELVLTPSIAAPAGRAVQSRPYAGRPPAVGRAIGGLQPVPGWPSRLRPLVPTPDQLRSGATAGRPRTSGRQTTLDRPRDSEAAS
jgi:hypothetical protein